jgi:hypothetical protein
VIYKALKLEVLFEGQIENMDCRRFKGVRCYERKRGLLAGVIWHRAQFTNVAKTQYDLVLGTFDPAG